MKVTVSYILNQDQQDNMNISKRLKHNYKSHFLNVTTNLLMFKFKDKVFNSLFLEKF